MTHPKPASHLPRFSRQLPSRQAVQARPAEPWGVEMWLALLFLLALVLCWVLSLLGSVVMGRWQPLAWVLAGGAALWALAAWDMRRTRLRLSALAADRLGEGICQFARQADCRTHDPLVVRAVYEALSEDVAVHAGLPTWPLRWNDELRRLLPDSDEVDNLVDEIAARAGRSMDDTTRNPYFDRVHTVGDVVRFLCAQPQVPTVQAA